jgi:hypothetical protein
VRVRSSLAALFSVLVASAGVLAVDASASAKKKSKSTSPNCGTVTPKKPENSGGGFGAFKIKIVKGKISCATAKTVFTNYYVKGKFSDKGGKHSVSLGGFKCTGGILPSTVITCKRKNTAMTGTDV